MNLYSGLLDFYDLYSLSYEAYFKSRVASPFRYFLIWYLNVCVRKEKNVFVWEVAL